MGEPKAVSVGERIEEHGILKNLFYRYAPLISVSVLLAAVLIGFGLTTDRFLTSTNLLNIIRQTAPAVIVAVAATLVITAAGIDLSVGSIVAASGTTAAVFLNGGVPPWLVLVGVVLMGGVGGSFNGYLIAYHRVPAFIVTLAALSIFLGISQLQSQGFSIAIDTPDWFLNIGQGRIGQLPVSGLIALVVVATGWTVLHRTSYGLHLAGIGANEEAVRRAGVRTRLVVTSVYAISGAASALAGIMVLTRLQSGSATAGRGLELQIIAAVVLGGTSLFGGRGTVIGSVFGVFTVALITNGLILNHVTPFYVSIIQGLILLIAVWVNTRVFSKWY